MNFKLILPAVGAAAAAAGAALFLIKRNESPAGSPAEAKNKAVGTAAVPEIKNSKSETYSFVSGYKKPHTVDVSFDYDGERFSAAIQSEDFLAYTSDSHAAILYGPDFQFQLEYAAYYSGEDYTALKADLTEKHPDAAAAEYAGVQGLRYTSGDNICMVFPVDADSYLLLTIFRCKDSDVKLAEIPQLADFRAVMNSLAIRMQD